MAVDRAGGAVAALLNGVRRPADGSVRPTRGTLALAALSEVDDVGARRILPGIPDAASLAAYDGFHLLRADTHGVLVWSWDGAGLVHQRMTPGDHIVVNLGVDRDDDPLVPHFRPLLKATPIPDPRPGGSTTVAWDGWVDLLRGDGLAPTDPRALIVRHEIGDHVYGSTSASLVGLSRSGAIRYDFTATPATPDWYEVTG